MNSGNTAVSAITRELSGAVTVNDRSMSTSANPMTRLEVEEKCYDLMVPVLGVRRARGLIETVWRIEKVADIRALRPLLRA